MHLWLHEPRSERINGVLADLRAAKLKPVPIDDHFFDDGAKAILHHDEWIHPLVMAATTETLERIRDLRRSGARNPVIVYRDFRSPERAIQALEAGADHVLVTPLRGDEVKARINAVFRRAHGHAEADFSIASLTIPFADEDPRIAGEYVPLRRIERQILNRLALEAGHPVSRAQIYEMIYGLAEKKPFVNVIDRHICNIRSKIASRDPRSSKVLRTYPGRGYALALDPGEGAEVPPREE